MTSHKEPPLAWRPYAELDRSITMNGLSCGQRIHRLDQCRRIDAEVTIEVGNGSGLAEMLDAMRNGLMAVDGPQP